MLRGKKKVSSDVVSCFLKSSVAVDLQISNLPRTKVTAKLQTHVSSRLDGFSGWTMGTDINSSVLKNSVSGFPSFQLTCTCLSFTMCQIQIMTIHTL